jgi:hypothetical protein
MTTLLAQVADLPRDRVTRLDEGPADPIAAALAGGPSELPAAIVHRGAPTDSPSEMVNGVLDDLESAAIGLFPAWLPGADGIPGPGGAGLAAVRAVAAAHARESGQYGPFLADLAAVALAGGRSAVRRRFAAEIRAAGLRRVLTSALGRERMVLIVDVPVGLSPGEEQVLVAGAEWLAARARCGVWLTGARLSTVDWIPSVRFAVEPSTVVDYPVVTGSPHPRSTVEAALEAALSAQTWAAGRRWNETYQPHALRPPVRLDLVWPAERCVVEIDGPEHCQPVRPTLVSAVGVFFMRQYLSEALPDELVEAGRVDGAHSLRIFWSIVLPIARPPMAVLFMITFVHAWNDFFWPFIVLDMTNPTVPVALTQLSAGYVRDQSLIMAGALLGTLPLLALFVVFGRQIVGGIMQGAVKG